MKKVKILILLSFALFTIQIHAQIENEIKSFVDSTEIIVNNGRKLLIEEIQSYNYSKAAEIFRYLKSKTEPKKCNAFNYTEELYISALIFDWDNFFDKAENIAGANKTSMCYNNNFEIRKYLYDEVVKNTDRIEANIQKKGFDQEKTDLLDIYFYLIKNGKQDNIYDMKVKTFKKKYPKSHYNDFISAYLPAPTFKGGLSWSIGVLGLLPQGKFAENFKSSIGGSMTMDFNINKLYFSLYLGGGQMKLKTPFHASTAKYDYTFFKDDDFSYLAVGLQSGIYLYRGNFFHFAPYISIGGAELKSNIFEDERDDNKEYRIFNSFVFGPGIHTEFKLLKFKNNNSYYSPDGYLSIKFDAGYDIITKYNYLPFKGNAFYAKLALNIGMGIF